MRRRDQRLLSLARWLCGIFPSGEGCAAAGSEGWRRTSSRARRGRFRRTAMSAATVGTYAVAQLRSASGGEHGGTLLKGCAATRASCPAMPNYIMRLSSPARIVSAEDEEIEIAEPNDPLYGEQWGLERINMPRSGRRRRRTESEEVVVAVIDTGIIYDHEDLADNMYEFDADTLSRMDVQESARGVCGQPRCMVPQQRGIRRGRG